MLNGSIAEEIFKRIQIGRGRKKYSSEIRQFALTLNFYSKKAYNYVRQKLRNVLPHTSTLTKWYSKIDASPGFLNEALVALKSKVLDAEKKGYKILCNLVLDEMSIMKKIEWDGRKTYGYIDLGINLTEDGGDEIDEAREAIVFMLVCLNGSWKIPAAYFFINGLSGQEKANLLTNFLEFINDSGIVITSLTFDGAPSNFGMCRSLGANFDIDSADFKTYFLHPVTKEEIYIFLDSCHMIKLIRNCLGTYKILTDRDEGQINWEYLEKLCNLQEDLGLHAATKIGKKHINWENEKMKVSLAVQTLSKSVAEALDFANIDLHISGFINSQPTANFCRIINNIFDIFNSRNRLSKRPFEKPLSNSTEEEYLKYLDDSIKYLKSLKLGNNDILKTKRKTGFLGYIISIESLKQLYKKRIIELKQIKYLLTYKLSQDHLEIFFSCIRSKGGFSNNPTCRQFQNIMKRLLIHSEISGQSSSNVIALDSTSILHCSSSQLEYKISPNEDLDTEDKITEEEYSIFNYYFNKTEFQINLYIDDVIAYIAGFVVRRIKKHVKCSQCLDFLESQISYSKLQTRKTYGALIKASEFVITICKYGEHCFKLYKDNLQIGIKDLTVISNRLVIYTFRNLPSKCADIFKDHLYDDEPLSNHYTLLSKDILKTYFKLRLHHYIAEMHSSQTRIRSKLTKTVLFKNQ